jgi:predicted adenine nucleotide alpha hydrolase (AANH) superfamily ATPase
MCYRLRLEHTAEKARELCLPAFTTTLLVSPYQDRDELIRQGQAAARYYGVEFLARDFRPGYRQGQTQARADGLYRQKYCGCLPSLEQSEFREKIWRDLESWSSGNPGTTVQK